MKQVLTLLIVIVLASTSFAQETATKEKKGTNDIGQVNRIENLLKSVTLTPEQETSFGEARKKLAADLAAVTENGLTMEMYKTRENKRTEGRKSGLKGKKLMAHAVDGLPEEQSQLFKTYDMSIKAFNKAVAGMLTDEQISALPKQEQKKMKMAAKGKGKGKGKGGKKKKKKKKKDAAEVE